MTASCGIGASELGEVFDFKRVLAEADRALYTAKKGDGLTSEDDGTAQRIGVSGA
jgi:GGDEF domain-containing protein